MITRGEVLGLVLVAVCAGGVVPATASTGAVRWSCASDGTVGPTGLAVGLDTDLPGVLHVGEPAGVTTTLTSALPAATAKRVYDDAAIKARFVEVTFALQGTIGTGALEQTLSVPSTPIPDQATATAVPFEGSSAPLTYVATAPGDDAVTAAILDATWTFRSSEGSVVSSLSSRCRPESATALVVDSVMVRSRSETTVALDAPSSVYGQPVLATAAVGTTAGLVPGTVAFSIDGVAYRTPLDAAGGAALALPRAVVGAHRVSATFLAADPAHHDTSTSASQIWTAARADTTIGVAVSGRRHRRHTRLRIRLAGTYDTVPNGKVRVVLRRRAPKRSPRTVAAPLARGRAGLSFGRLAQGSYRLIVHYRGDAGHLPTRRVKNFRVR